MKNHLFLVTDVLYCRKKNVYEVKLVAIGKIDDFYRFYSIWIVKTIKEDMDCRLFSIHQNREEAIDRVSSMSRGNSDQISKWFEEAMQ